MYDSLKDKQTDDDLLKLSNCCMAKIVFHKKEFVCSCCGMKTKQKIIKMETDINDKLLSNYFFKDETLGNPPVGRTKKAHNNIMKMNKKKGQ